MHAEARARIAALAPSAIFHGGDIGALSVLDELASVAPVVAVRGNIDSSESALPMDAVIDVESGGVRRLRVFLTHIAVYGPKLRGQVLLAAQKSDCDLVVCGHSHVPFLGRDRQMVVFNPGSIGPKRFQLPIVFGEIRLESPVRLRHVSCETGETWLPG